MGSDYFHELKATSGSGYLANSEVYDAEAVAAHEAMKLAKERVQANPNVREILLFLDNSSVVDSVLGKTPASSQSSYIGLRKIAKDLLPEVTTKVAWVPGHKDVFGNEKADTLAKEGASLPRHNSHLSTITHIMRWKREKLRLMREEEWDEVRPLYYKKWRLDAPAMPPELKLHRPILYRLLAERSGHGDFVEYHERFGHDASSRCKCGAPRTQGHFVKCRYVEPFLPEIPDKLYAEGISHLEYLLGPRGHKEFQKLVEDTSPYGHPQDPDC
ncbi:hypothetical protein THAR02_11428 [Trichoderma harzianum]|uniref:RNase H type-1 domain-containing protein n=1 Tax=Trichoderma harzianum TaxID=5544 RepID=A0A0F9Z775_TRIHA|nr:hypothetical protein THAR02_11428 [Trichoderma harzianum]